MENTNLSQTLLEYGIKAAKAVGNGEYAKREVYLSVYLLVAGLAGLTVAQRKKMGRIGG